MTAIPVATHGPSLEGKVAVITGGSSGIGLATAKVLSSKGAYVFNLDPSEPPVSENLPPTIEYCKCDQSSWSDLIAAFTKIKRVDIAVANGGITENPNYFDDSFDANGILALPSQAVFDVNLKGSVNFCKIALSRMRKQQSGGAIVIVSSATGYAPEHTLPLCSACKAAMIHLVRALQSQCPFDKITINSVAPAATITAQIPEDLLVPIQAMGLPVSTAEHVAWAIYYSATAREDRKVELYGKDEEGDKHEGRWNGRTILTLGDQWTEVEEPLAQLKSQWWGQRNVELTRKQQAATDSRART